MLRLLQGGWRERESPAYATKDFFSLFRFPFLSRLLFRRSLSSLCVCGAQHVWRKGNSSIVSSLYSRHEVDGSQMDAERNVERTEETKETLFKVKPTKNH